MLNVSEKKVKISVIIPAYNMAEYVDEAICSVLRGSFEDLEVVVVDDGSSDMTESIVSRYTDPSSSKHDPRVRYTYQENKGKSVAVNHGLEVARGTYMTILDADDQIPPRSLLLQYNALNTTSRFPGDLAIGGFQVFDGERTIAGYRPAPSGENPRSLHKRFYFSYKSPFHMNACLFSRALYKRVGPFDTRLRRCQDIDYSLRLLKAARQIYWVDAPVYWYRKHRGSFDERLRIRLKTLTHRPVVYWKNYKGWRRYLAVVTGIMLDAGKLLYETTGNYHN